MNRDIPHEESITDHYPKVEDAIGKSHVTFNWNYCELLGLITICSTSWLWNDSYCNTQPTNLSSTKSQPSIFKSTKRERLRHKLAAAYSAVRKAITDCLKIVNSFRPAKYPDPQRPHCYLKPFERKSTPSFISRESNYRLPWPRTWG